MRSFCRVCRVCIDTVVCDHSRAHTPLDDDSMTLETCRDPLADARAQAVMGMFTGEGERALKWASRAAQRQNAVTAGRRRGTSFSARRGSDRQGKGAKMPTDIPPPPGFNPTEVRPANPHRPQR